VSALRLRYGVTLDRTDVVTRIPHPKHETTLPVMLSVEEVGRFLGAVRNLKHREFSASVRGLRRTRLLSGEDAAGGRTP